MERLVVIVAVLAVLVGCDGSGARAVPPVDAAPICTHIQQLRTLAGRVTTFGTPNPFRGDICVEGRTDLPCVTPAADDGFAMCVPSGGDFGLRFTKAGFEKTLYLHGPANPVPGPFSIGDDGFVGTSYWGAIGASYPPTTTGHLVVVVSKDSSPLANAAVRVTPQAPVVYLGANDLPEPSRTTTGPRGVALVGDLAPGSYDLDAAEPNNLSCSFLTGGYKSPDVMHQVRVTVQAGVTTVALLRCMP